MEGYDNCLHFVEYGDLVTNPKQTMKAIYEFLGEEYFEHTFANLENLHRENDLEIYGLSDMHEVRSVLKSTAPDPKEILSENILSKCKGTEFWRTITSEYEEDEIPNDDDIGEDCNSSFLIGV